MQLFASDDWLSRYQSLINMRQGGEQHLPFWVHRHLCQIRRMASETRANFCTSQSLHKPFCICKVCDQIYNHHKSIIDLKFCRRPICTVPMNKKLLVLEILSLHSICGNHIFDQILYICGRFAKTLWAPKIGSYFLCGIQLHLVSTCSTLGKFPYASWRAYRAEIKDLNGLYAKL
jgi:hypothetical protein